MNFNSCKVLLTEHTQAMNHYMITWVATEIPISMIVSGGTMGGGERMLHQTVWEEPGRHAMLSLNSRPHFSQVVWAWDYTNLMYIYLHGHVPCSQLAVLRLGSILYVDQEMDVRTFFVTQERSPLIQLKEQQHIIWSSSGKMRLWHT